MWLFPIGRPHFEELSFSINLLVSFSTFDLEEFGVAKFSRIFFHLAPHKIHPLALLIPVVSLFYCIFCIVVAMKFSYYNPYITHQVQAYKPILQFSFSMLATSKRGITPPSCARTPHWLLFSLTTFSFLKKFGLLEKV